MNYKTFNADTIPLAQLYEPANTYAIEHDHDYLENSASENFLKQIHVTSITEDAALGIEKTTRGQAENPTWFAERRFRLHASKFGAICATKDKRKMAANLVCHTRVQAAAVNHGRLFEGTAISQYEQQCNAQVQRGVGITVSLDRPYLACSPDGIRDGCTLVEVKCPYSARNSQITPETVPYLYLDENTGLFALDKSHNYYFQIQGQLFITRKKVCLLIVYTFKDMAVIQISRDDAFIDTMNANLELFFNDYFKPALLEKFFYRNYVAFDFASR